MSSLKRDFLADHRTSRQQSVSNVLHRVYSDQFASTSHLQDVLDPIGVTDSFEITSQMQLQRRTSKCSSILSEYAEHDFDNSSDYMPSDNDDRKNSKIQLSESDKEELSRCGGSYRVIEKALSIGIKTAGKNPKDYAISRMALCSH